jgi:uncharacterized membrane protein
MTMAEESPGPLTRLRELADRNEGTSKLADALQDYAAARASRLVTGALGKVGSLTESLAEGGVRNAAGPLAAGAGKLAQGKGAASAAAAAGGKDLKDKAAGSLGKLLGGGSGGGSGAKSVHIVEDIDVGVPVRVAYDQWTRFADFSNFAKGVRSAEKTDETSSDWKAKVLWSTRTWKARVTEQVQDRRIAWSSEGSKGTTEGAVTFHPLGENLTRVLVVVRYHPKGLFERTGNIWRAQGRRLRLDLKRYRTRLMMMAEAEAGDLEGWRGEIREGEVVLSHEDAMADEDAEREPGDENEAEEEEYEDEENHEDGPEEDEESPGEAGEPAEGYDEEPPEDAGEDAREDEEPLDDEEADDEEPVDEAGEPLEGYDEEPPEDAGEDDEPFDDEEEPAGRPAR